MERGFDLTFPKVPLTGAEKTLEQLIQPDERSTAYRLDVETLQSPYLELDKSLSDVIPVMLKRRTEVCRQLAVYGYFCYEFQAVSMFWSISCVEMALKLKFRELNPGPFALLRKGEGGREETLESDGITLEKRLHEGWHIPGNEDFDYSFGKLLKWAFTTDLLPHDLPIPLQEILNSFDHHFTSEIFLNAALRDGLIQPNPTLADIRSCWFGLTEEQRKQYSYRSSGVLIEELPRLAASLGHPSICNTLVGPRSSLGAYELMTDIVSRLWPDSKKPRRPDTFQRREPTTPEQSENLEIHAERITLYDSLHIPAGSQVPERVTLSFGADGGGITVERLFDLDERQLIEQVVTNPLLVSRLLEHFGIEYPNCWIITEILTRTASTSWPYPKPGDIDLVCGRMKDGRPDFDYICGVQVKLRKVKTLEETGDFASGAGTEQSHWTARMGFDRTLLLHWIVRVPLPLPEGYAPSWNAIINADFERAAKACYGTIRQKFEKDRELYGFGWLGWGQAYGKQWETCGGFAINLVYPPPHRPAIDSDEARNTRAEMIESFRSLILTQDAGRLPLIVQRKGK